MSAVGAYQWKGGYQYGSTFKEGDNIDSYSGKNESIAITISFLFK